MKNIKKIIASAMLMTPMLTMVSYADSVEGVVTTETLNVRDSYTLDSKVSGQLSKGDRVKLVKRYGDWFNAEITKEVTDSKGVKTKVVESKWLHKDYIEVQGTTQPLTYEVTEDGRTLADIYKIQKERALIGGNIINAKYSKGVVSESATGYINATDEDLVHYINPNNFKDEKGMMQFLRLDRYTEGVKAEDLDKLFAKLPRDKEGKNVFDGMGKAFIDSAKKYNIDVAYLVAHSLWETGNGTSTLAKGQEVTHFKGKKLDKPVKVYNFFGIGAFDGSANLSGKEASYSNGWTSIENTIDGSAKWLSEKYIHSEKYKQNTLYKMKFNHDISWHQYATDINWSNGITTKMLEVAKLYTDGDNMLFEIPKYADGDINGAIAYYKAQEEAKRLAEEEASKEEETVVEPTTPNDGVVEGDETVIKDVIPMPENNVNVEFIPTEGEIVEPQVGDTVNQ